MSYTRTLLTFLVISLVLVIGYAIMTAIVAGEASKVIDGGAEVAAAAKAQSSVNCSRAKERYNQISRAGSGQNPERHALDLEQAIAEIDRSCAE